MNGINTISELVEAMNCVAADLYKSNPNAATIVSKAANTIEFNIEEMRTLFAVYLSAENFIKHLWADTADLDEGALWDHEQRVEKALKTMTDQVVMVAAEIKTHKTMPETALSMH